jgi:predicted RNA-binding Zn-ribbon protein involved in translation (DUF1610 family)
MVGSPYTSGQRIRKFSETNSSLSYPAGDELMKLRYVLKFECRNCGVFEKTNLSEIPESYECPKCHRTSEFQEGSVRRVMERKRSVPKNQKRIVDD